MTWTVTILFPKGAEFNLEYYLKVHLPMAQDFTSAFLSWKVFEFSENDSFEAEAHLEWSSGEEFIATTKKDGWEKIAGDLVNYTKVAPLLLRHKAVF